MDPDLLLKQYPPQVSELVKSLHKYLLEKIPGVSEEVDLPSRLLAYSIGPGMKGIVFTIIPSQKGVKLGINRGIDLDDPDQLLEGSGKVHKYVKIIDEDQLKLDNFNRLVDSAIALARIRVGNDR